MTEPTPEPQPGPVGYWIRSITGVYALVATEAERDLWTEVRGWAVADEPPPAAQICIVHAETQQTGCIPYEALDGAWSGLGWAAGPPPEPLDPANDPVLVDPPLTEPGPPGPGPELAPAKTATTTTTKAAASGARTKE
ncbi:hypothetical protein [Actinoplanes rectilineatus]|uniref:hypothetical protein n=1 Tax=Actinoplanes rectilineatus TaxID=113571 RepID=UPI0005F2ADC3|nr:hypothetical protein [Actinoplanes rectilineatus]